MPIEKDRAILTIQGAINEIEIEIEPGKVRLLRPSNKYIDENIKDVWMSPALLFSVSEKITY